MKSGTTPSDRGIWLLDVLATFLDAVAKFVTKTKQNKKKILRKERCILAYSLTVQFVMAEEAS